MLQGVFSTPVRVLGPNLPLELDSRPASYTEITVTSFSQISGISKVMHTYICLVMKADESNALNYMLFIMDLRTLQFPLCV